MKSRKEIKDTTIKILRIVFSNSSRTIWIMAFVGGLFAANLRQNGRLNLINQGSGSYIHTFNGDTEYYEPYDENLCGKMIRNFAKSNYEYKVKTGEITQEQIKKDALEEEKRLEGIKDRIAKGDWNVLAEDSEYSRKTEKTEAYIARFIESCETTLGKTAKNGYWPTVLVWTFFSWIGMTIAREVVKD
tara:strand:- start:38 stop:601 length:564 start_codon:yes stop_codon:yes gene_type:complete